MDLGGYVFYPLPEYETHAVPRNGETHDLLSLCSCDPQIIITVGECIAVIHTRTEGGDAWI